MNTSMGLVGVKALLRFTVISFLLCITPTLQPISAAIVINEILPKVDDPALEWIELYNNGEESVSLDRWKLENSNGEVTSFQLNASSILPPHTFLTFTSAQSLIKLSKNGDTVKLIDEKNNTVDAQSFPGVLGYNVSMGRTSDGNGVWAMCTIPTKDARNTCPVPTNTPTPLPTEIPTATPLPTPTIVIDTPFYSPTYTPTPIIEQMTPTILPMATPSSSLTPNKSSRWLLFLLIPILWFVIILVIILKKRNSRNN